MRLIEPRTGYPAELFMVPHVGLLKSRVWYDIVCAGERRRNHGDRRSRARQNVGKCAAPRTKNVCESGHLEEDRELDEPQAASLAARSGALRARCSCHLLIDLAVDL